MNVLDQLALALGFATLAGLNLYLTVLIVGGAMRFGWITNLSEQYQSLAVLGEMPVLVVAGTLFCVEFFADKVPWVDSLWDTVHTAIRPIGGGLLAVNALGDVDPGFQVILGMLAGGATLMTHGVKASTRLAVNQSPEPVSNSLVSVGEDVLVAGGTFLVLTNPRISAFISVLLLVGAAWALPKIFRRLRSTFVLVWNRFNPVEAGLTAVPPEMLEALDAKGGPGDLKRVKAAVTGRMKGIPTLLGGQTGYLVMRENEDDRFWFLTHRFLRPRAQEIVLTGARYRRHDRWLSKDLHLNWEGSRGQAVFRFGEGEQGMETFLRELRSMGALPAAEVRGTVDAPADSVPA